MKPLGSTDIRQDRPSYLSLQDPFSLAVSAKALGGGYEENARLVPGTGPVSSGSLTALSRNLSGRSPACIGRTRRAIVSQPRKILYASNLPSSGWRAPGTQVSRFWDKPVPGVKLGRAAELWLEGTPSRCPDPIALPTTSPPVASHRSRSPVYGASPAQPGC